MFSIRRCYNLICVSLFVRDRTDFRPKGVRVTLRLDTEAEQEISRDRK